MNTNGKILNSTSSIVLVATLTALVALFTLIIKVPIPSRGYVSLADVAIYFSSFAFGPVIGAIAGGAGTALADILGGYAVPWAPISFLVHALQGFVFGWFARKSNLLMLIAGWLLSAVIMVLGYFVSGAIIYGKGVAITGILGDITQVSVGGFGGYLLYMTVLKSFPKLDKFKNHL